MAVAANLNFEETITEFASHSYRSVTVRMHYVQTSSFSFARWQRYTDRVVIDRHVLTPSEW